MVFVMSTVSVSPLVVLISIYLLANARNFYSNYVLRKALSRGERPPDRLANLPRHHTSPADFFRSKKKTNRFVDKVLRGQEAELLLDSDDINNIYLRGSTVNYYIVSIPAVPFIKSRYANEYFYFWIDADSILYKKITYPSFEGRDGVQTFTRQLSFSRDGLIVKQKEVTSRVNEMNLAWITSDRYDFVPRFLYDSYVIEKAIHSSEFMFFLFSVVDSPDISPKADSDRAIYESVVRVIERISDIKIVGNKLCIKSTGK